MWNILWYVSHLDHVFKELKRELNVEKYKKNTLRLPEHSVFTQKWFNKRTDGERNPSHDLSAERTEQESPRSFHLFPFCFNSFPNFYRHGLRRQTITTPKFFYSQGKQWTRKFLHFYSRQVYLVFRNGGKSLEDTMHNKSAASKFISRSQPRNYASASSVNASTGQLHNPNGKYDDSGFTLLLIKTCPILFLAVISQEPTID